MDPEIILPFHHFLTVVQEEFPGDQGGIAQLGGQGPESEEKLKFQCGKQGKTELP